MEEKERKWKAKNLFVPIWFFIWWFDIYIYLFLKYAFFNNTLLFATIIFDVFFVCDRIACTLYVFCVEELDFFDYEYFNDFYMDNENSIILEVWFFLYFNPIYARRFFFLSTWRNSMIQ